MTRSAPSPDFEAIADAAARWVARRDAGLNAGEQHELDAWLAADPRHRSALEHYARTWEVFDQPERAGTTGAVVRALGIRARRRRQRIGAAAAALALMALGSVLWQTRVSRVSDHPVAEATTAVVRFPESRTLPDGSIVELKAGASVAVDFRGQQRRVILQKGEAHFQVVKDITRPFVVNASGVETRAVGTAFSVELGDNAVDVLVTEGRVAVSRGPAPPPLANRTDGPSTAPMDAPNQLFVDAGQSVIVETAAALSSQPVVTNVAQAELAERLAWRSVRLEFSDTPLERAVALMNRSGGRGAGRPGITLVIDPASPGLAAEPVSGLFRADNAETFVRMLELSLGVQAERRGENEILLRKAQ